MSFFDRTGAGRCSGGEAVRPALEIAGSDGVLADLSGRTFVYLITSAGGATKHHEQEATIAGAGTRAVASIPGAVTRAIASKVGLEHWWIEQVEDGFREWNRAALTVRSAGPAAVGATAPAEDVVRVADRGVLRIFADGAPGISAWTGLGFDSAAEMQAELIDDPIAAALGEAAQIAAAEASAALVDQFGPQILELAEQLSPSGATANVNLPANAILIGDLM